MKQLSTIKTPTIKMMALAVALALPAAPGFAASMSDIVTTRDDQDIHQRFGRDSIYAMQNQSPAQSESRVSSGSGGVGDVFAGISAAGASAWHKVTSAFEPGSHAAVAQERRLYGRAGGYVGTDQLALLERAGPATEVGQPVTAGESMAIGAAERDVRYPAASESQLYGRNEDRFPQPATPQPTTPQPTTPQPTVAAPVVGESVSSELPASVQDSAYPTASEAQPYGREAQPYGRNEDQVSESGATTPAVVATEPATTEESANDQLTAAGEARPNGGAGSEISDAAPSANENEPVTTTENEPVTTGEAASDSQSNGEGAGAGESAQSAPSPDSVTVMDEEMSRAGEQPGESSVSDGENSVSDGSVPDGKGRL